MQETQEPEVGMTDENIRILLVDDDEDDYILTRDYFTDLGESRFELEWASTYEAGLAAIKNKQHHVYLLDYRLGERDGLELLQRAVALGISAPIILLTSQGDRDLDLQVMEMGASDYLNKSTLTSELLERSIRYALERVHTEEDLRESEEKFRSLSENGPDIIYTLGVEGSFTYVNPAWEEIVGYGRDETLGKYFVDFMEEKDSGDHAKLFKVIRDGNKIVRSATITLINKDGSPRLFNFSGAPNLNLAGEITGMVGLLKDITEHRKTEAQLRQAQKMEAIGTLAGGIAHDFNNILMAIIGHADLAKMKLPGDSEVIYNLNQVKSAGERAKRLIQQILAFSRMGEQQRIALSLTPLIKEALKFLKSTLPTSIEIRDYLEADPGIIEADATQIHQIVMNFCTNAEHAMREEGGTLHVKLIRVEVDRQTALQHHELHTGPHVRLTVTDTGCGMEPETLEHIFDPYFTTKEVGEGTGLGLSVVHGIVNTHGGAITVKSEPGKGTTFHVYFPIIEKEEKLQERSEGPLPTGNERILFVDDEQVIVYIGEKTLGQLGYDVVTKANGVDALELFRADPDRFDLVITDMTMPRMTGDQFARELIKLRPDIPIILCTGFNPKISKEQAGKIGIKAFVMKPLVRRDMANIVRKVLDA